MRVDQYYARQARIITNDIKAVCGEKQNRPSRYTPFLSIPSSFLWCHINLLMYVYVYAYICVCIRVYIYRYINGALIIMNHEVCSIVRCVDALLVDINSYDFCMCPSILLG